MSSHNPKLGINNQGDGPLFEFSAGGVVLNEGKVLLICARDLKGKTVWTLPKGHLHEHESSEQAALREVEEETGWQCRIESELPNTQYWFQYQGRRVNKTVRWFQMTAVRQVGEPDHEVDEIAWVPVDQAMDRLMYESNKNLLRAIIRTKGSDEEEK